MEFFTTCNLGSCQSYLAGSSVSPFFLTLIRRCGGENIQSFLYFFHYFLLFFLAHLIPRANLFQRAPTTRAQIPLMVVVADALAGIYRAFRRSHDKISRRIRFARLVPPRRRDDPERAGVIPVPLATHKHNSVVWERVEP